MQYRNKGFCTSVLDWPVIIITGTGPEVSVHNRFCPRSSDLTKHDLFSLVFQMPPITEDTSPDSVRVFVNCMVCQPYQKSTVPSVNGRLVNPIIRPP